jgi:pimeloyl-ACP methyl ester carboxylesterase
MALLLGALVPLAWRPVRRHARAAALLTDLTGSAPVDGVATEELMLDGVRARRYGTEGPPVLLLHGVHPDGIEEPRLVRFASLLAKAGLLVVTPELGALSRVELDPRAPESIGRAARALAARERRASVGVVGISFGGGLALVAAAEGEPAIGAVMAIGPHHDARRCARFWLGEPVAGPDGERPAVEPERYGPLVLAYAYASDYLDGVPDREPARAVLAALLREDAQAARQGLAALSADARARIDPLRHGQSIAPAIARLNALLEAHAGDLEALSPAGRLRGVQAPVFLLHGLGDPLIPSIESHHLARELPEASLAALLRSPLLGHADTRPATLVDELEVVHLMARVLAAFESL